MSLQFFFYSLTASNLVIIILVRKGVILPDIIISFYVDTFYVGEKRQQSSTLDWE